MKSNAWVQCCFAVVLAGLLLHTASIDGAFKADPIENQPRTWTSQNGKWHVEATLQSIGNDSIFLKRKDNGKEIELPLVKLSKSDRDYVRDLRRGTGRQTERKPRASTSAPSSPKSQSALSIPGRVAESELPPLETAPKEVRDVIDFVNNYKSNQSAALNIASNDEQKARILGLDFILACPLQKPKESPNAELICRYLAENIRKRKTSKDLVDARRVLSSLLMLGLFGEAASIALPEIESLREHSNEVIADIANNVSKHISKQEVDPNCWTVLGLG